MFFNIQIDVKFYTDFRFVHLTFRPFSQNSVFLSVGSFCFIMLILNITKLKFRNFIFDLGI